MTPVEFCQMLFAWIIFMERLPCQCLRRKAKKERMLMMGTCSRQRSLSMKYFNTKHTKQRRWLLLKSSHYSETKPVYLDFLILQDSEYLSPSILIFKSEIELSTSVFTVNETQCYTSIQMAQHSAYKCFSPRHLNAASMASDNMGHFLSISFVIGKVLRHFYYKI